MSYNIKKKNGATYLSKLIKFIPLCNLEKKLFMLYYLLLYVYLDFIFNVILFNTII